jgi:formylglycine-generating enzyme required for sulfatase activity
MPLGGRQFCLCLLAVGASVAAQEAFTSFLELRILPETPSAVLTIYGYPGTTNQLQYLDALGGSNQWVVLSNINLTNSPCTIADPSFAPARQRFYRVRVLGAKPITVPTNFVWIPPGRFLMGSPLPEQDRGNQEGPQMAVTLTRGFYMGKYLVTQGEYLAIMGNNPSYFQGDLSRPVEATGWYNATNYCGRLTSGEQSAGRLPTTWRYRLPTEAEWEYACRAGTTTSFFYGEDPGYAELTKYGWYDDNSYTTNQPPGAYYLVWNRYYTSHSVGQKLPNPWGLYDMCGNITQWCQDWFGPYPGGAVIDPQGPATGTERVLRNGSWLDDAHDLRSACRYSTEPDNVSGIYGFRVVLAPVQF